MEAGKWVIGLCKDNPRSFRDNIVPEGEIVQPTDEGCSGTVRVGSFRRVVGAEVGPGVSWIPWRGEPMTTRRTPPSLTEKKKTASSRAESADTGRSRGPTRGSRYRPASFCVSSTEIYTCRIYMGMFQRVKGLISMEYIASNFLASTRRAFLQFSFPLPQTTRLAISASSPCRNFRKEVIRYQSTMSAVEAAKRAAAKVAVANHYPKDARFVGIGSGTTIIHVVEAIKELGVDTSRTIYVPTGYQSKQLIVAAGLTAVTFDSLPEGTVLDVAFDGADEVDDDLNCIKGGGACLFQEKIVALQAKEFICVADSRKLQKRLLTNWKYIPIEVSPFAVYRVLRELKKIGSIEPAIRLNTIAKEGPLKTDQDFFIIDAPFKPLLTPTDIAAGKDGSGTAGFWEVNALAKTIKQIPGVLEVGLFTGFTGPQAQAHGAIGGQRPVAAYFGMPDGTVTTRKAAV